LGTKLFENRMLDRLIILLKYHLFCDAIANIDDERRFQVGGHLGELTRNGQDREDTGLVNGSQAQLTQLCCRKPYDVIGLEDAWFKNRESQPWICQGLEPKDQSLVSWIHQTKILVIRKPKYSARNRNDFVCGNFYLAKTSCLYDHNYLQGQISSLKSE